VQVAEEVSRRSPDFLLVLSKVLEEELSFLFLLAEHPLQSTNEIDRLYHSPQEVLEPTDHSE
jgi:hypothetical protein